MRPSRPILAFVLLAACSEYGLEEKQASPTTGEPDIVVSPTTLAFDPSALDCQNDREVTISNEGDAALEITGTWVESDGHWSAEFIEERLAPGASTTMVVRYAPTAAGEHAATVIVASDDPDEAEVVVAATGTAGDVEIVGDTFVQEADPVDVLWVIDNSSSMGQEQARVIAEISAFFTWFETLNLDYHMGVVTSDIVTTTMAGRLQGSPTYIDASTANAETELAEAIDVGTDDLGDESGLYGAELALTEPILSAENAGFYRPDARLAVVFLSDEPEQSAFDAQHYVDFFTALKPDPTNVLVSAIVGDRTAGCANVCDGTDQTAQPGDKYLDVVEAFDGVFGSICTCDLSPTLDEIGMEATLFVRTFTLSRVPSDPAELRVSVDNEPSTDWTYDGNANAIVFGTAPVNGQEIDATYPVTLTCAE